ncbi:hypothetical protein M408DRAFT_326610 [Serendipita vermifera MAFF 305830]|uniref:Uncharacterized protein n=1 Tax=Serendipita vermifera MAFF 305830 TaxID=933852 RepID=A0A0C3BN84_SERVB|nr:hypothetical protein M408DRAFT_326610 [Serendipita vermifera MAFF 305830]
MTPIPGASGVVAKACNAETMSSRVTNSVILMSFRRDFGRNGAKGTSCVGTDLKAGLGELVQQRGSK